MSTSSQPTYWVYIMTNHSGTLYIGMTNNLERRIWEHRQGVVEGFASKYRITKLVLAEPFSEVRDAIAREKQLKKWSREKKLNLIRASNPDWRDLAAERFGSASCPLEPARWRRRDLSTSLEMTPEVRGWSRQLMSACLLRKHALPAISPGRATLSEQLAKVERSLYSPPGPSNASAARAYALVASRTSSIPTHSSGTWASFGSPGP